MKAKSFNQKFSKVCDDVYAIVGEKETYSKEDAEVMLNGATEIITKHFNIHAVRLSACQNRVASRSKNYAEKLAKTMGFEGAILALTFGILEGTGEISENGGIKILSDASFNTGLKMSRDI